MMTSCISLMIPTLLTTTFLTVNGDLPHQYQVNLCAQVQQESLWQPDAVSPVGARGLTQFMPPTWPDYGPRVGCPDFEQAFDPECSLRAQRLYMGDLLASRICQGDGSVEKWALAYACYNAGLGWIRKERRLCAGPLHPKCDPSRWFDNVEHTCRRRASSCHETRTYNERIRINGAREMVQ